MVYHCFLSMCVHLSQTQTCRRSVVSVLSHALHAGRATGRDVTPGPCPQHILLIPQAPSGSRRSSAVRSVATSCCRSCYSLTEDEDCSHRGIVLGETWSNAEPIRKWRIWATLQWKNNFSLISRKLSILPLEWFKYQTNHTAAEIPSLHFYACIFTLRVVWGHSENQKSLWKIVIEFSTSIIQWSPNLWPWQVLCLCTRVCSDLQAPLQHIQSTKGQRQSCSVEYQDRLLWALSLLKRLNE